MQSHLYVANYLNCSECSDLYSKYNRHRLPFTLSGGASIRILKHSPIDLEIRRLIKVTHDRAMHRQILQVVANGCDIRYAHLMLNLEAMERGERLAAFDSEESKRLIAYSKLFIVKAFDVPIARDSKNNDGVVVEKGDGGATSESRGDTATAATTTTLDLVNLLLDYNMETHVELDVASDYWRKAIKHKQWLPTDSPVVQSLDDTMKEEIDEIARQRKRLYLKIAMAIASAYKANLALSNYSQSHNVLYKLATRILKGSEQAEAKRTGEGQEETTEEEIIDKTAIEDNGKEYEEKAVLKEPEEKGKDREIVV